MTEFDSERKLQEAYRLAWLKLQVEFSDLLKQDTSDWIKLCAFARLRLRQFKLDGSYDPAYVINEALIRACEAIRNGKSIEKPSAWLRATMMNIVRELSRQSSEHTELDENSLEGLENSVEPDLTEEFRRAKIAFWKLKPQERKLLRLKILKGLQWQEIQKIYAAEGQHISEATLRQRKTRTLRRLRELYFNLKPPD